MPDFHTTPYQTQYIAWLLSRQIGRDSPDLLASTLVDARVDLNPHQVEAALFAFLSPLSQGVILADEVGLGKTIEAGLVIAQRWAERKRRILIITPANLRKQWHQELQDKFSLQALILEAKSYKEQPYISYTRRIPMVERRTATVAATLEEKLQWQKRQRELEDKRNQLRRRIFDRQDEIDAQRSRLIAELEGLMTKQTRTNFVFTIQWELK